MRAISKRHPTHWPSPRSPRPVPQPPPACLSRNAKRLSLDGKQLPAPVPRLPTHPATRSSLCCGCGTLFAEHRVKQCTTCRPSPPSSRPTCPSLPAPPWSHCAPGFARVPGSGTMTPMPGSRSTPPPLSACRANTTANGPRSACRRSPTSRSPSPTRALPAAPGTSRCSVRWRRSTCSTRAS
ncbi:hypothetical protein D3C81_1638130 [compost metagenome]